MDAARAPLQGGGPRRAAARPRRPRLIDPPSHILIACMPKSGSTFLSDVIAELPGFHRAVLVPAHGRREQELDELSLQHFDRYNFVAQNHVQYSDWTGEMCRAYGVAPIVLVRDLLDVIVSLRDHLRNEGHVSPIFFAEPHHAALDNARLEEMIVRLAVPWYVNFYMSWRRAPDALLIHFEDMTEAPVEAISRILAAAGASAAPAEIEAAVSCVQAAGGSRFNVGMTGRGAGLAPDVIRAVLEMLEFYPEAAADPYIQAVRERALAALAGTSPPPRRAALPAPSTGPLPSLTKWWRRKAERIVMRGVLPLTLAVLAVLYWLWPNDLVPDAHPNGYVDDVVCLLLAGILAGRLTMFKPRSPRPKRARSFLSSPG